MPPHLMLRSARVLDVEAGTYLEDHDVLVVDGRIAEVARGISAPGDTHVVDVGGATVLPGLADAHVHVTAATADLGAMESWSPHYVAAHTAGILRAMLQRGFTTVRDAAGADWGLARALDEGLLT